jgi:hypothetical protein
MFPLCFYRLLRENLVSDASSGLKRGKVETPLLRGDLDATSQKSTFVTIRVAVFMMFLLFSGII